MIIGGGLAGGNAAKALRDDGYGGAVSMIGVEAGVPFGRPPLSKTYLRGEETLDGWLVAPEGWYASVRNLRAAGEAQLTQGRSHEFVRTVELTKPEAAAFFADVLGPYMRRLPPPVRWIMPPLLGLSDVLSDANAAAERHPVFELKTLRETPNACADSVSSDRRAMYPPALRGNDDRPATQKLVQIE